MNRAKFSSAKTLTALSREQRRNYLTTLALTPEKRVDARHRYLMLKEMPFRDEKGRPMRRQKPQQTVIRQSLQPFHVRRTSTHLAAIHRSSSTFHQKSLTQVYTDRELRSSRLRRKRESQVAFLIQRCQETCSTSRRSLSPQRKSPFSPQKRISKRTPSMQSIF